MCFCLLCMYMYVFVLSNVYVHLCQCYHSFLPLTWVSLAESQRAMACPGKCLGI